MESKIKNIINKVLKTKPISISQIKDFGSVNEVFNLTCQSNNYIVRLNQCRSKRLEFLKEEWCINKVKKLGVLVPKVLHNEIHDGSPIMIQEKIEGLNGSLSSKSAKLKIWEILGSYALKYSKIKQIDIPELIKSEFHDNWKSKLEYNIKQLNSEDSLLSNKIFTPTEHDEVKRALISLRNRPFEVGLTHGDLSPRNVILNDSSAYLLDWGTAEINIVPHTEIGIVLIEGEADEEEFQSFLKGMKIDKKEYGKMEWDIRKLNLLHRLDKYRWAEAYDVGNINRYSNKLKKVYQELLECTVLEM